jgi:formiminotetrahydrofolate cyclodeaminase
MEETTLQVLSIIAAVVAAFAAALEAKSLKRSARKKRNSDHARQNDQIHSKFLRVEQLLNEGKTKEAEQVFRDVASQ